MCFFVSNFFVHAYGPLYIYQQKVGSAQRRGYGGSCPDVDGKNRKDGFRLHQMWTDIM
ncbi:hypothetical protein DPMN_135917 [Dreissena polymorpha]|uniref:Uncharacterized protein n=1 Tax=Dreissena polymorpha TaxID=45954 RepID=A0A9D4G4T7_DREPO|nr:hypothetical protein DPMN_135917 [Dreissena polymorpha]